MKNILIVGMGEIGNSVARLYDDSYKIYYANRSNVNNSYQNINKIKNEIVIDVMHICIKYSDEFIDIVTDYIKKYDPKLTLIDSTVMIGVTRKIFDSTQVDIVHTPVMGIHPNLTTGILTFKKIIGPISEKAGKSAAEHLKDINVNTIIYECPEESEAAKLLSTTYYGLNISFMQEIHKLCNEYNLNFDNVYTNTNNLYNDGYTKLDMLHVRRPVLKYMGEGIGGHCVYQNADMLEKHNIKIDAIKNILKAGRNKELSR